MTRPVYPAGQPMEERNVDELT